MRYLITVALLVLSCQLFAHDEYPRIEKITVQDKLFHGQIDKYPITIYLKFHQYSNYHAGVYSVEGWYYYDKIKTKIPLAGLYNGSELNVYHFRDTAKGNELLKFREMRSNHWEDMEYYENIEGYDEKFVLSKNENYWTKGSKKLEVGLEENDLQILKVTELLVLDSGTAFDLHNFGSWTWNFEIAAQTKGTFILHFEHGSRLNVMGRCGAGVEKGFMRLDFDKDNKLLKYDGYIYESCNYSISTEEQSTKDNDTTVYHCHDYMTEESYSLTVDLKELTIEKKEND